MDLKNEGSKLGCHNEFVKEDNVLVSFPWKPKTKGRVGCAKSIFVAEI